MIKKYFLYLILFTSILSAQSFDVNLVVVTNNGSDFVVDVQVTGNSLPTGTDISSGQFDITYDNSKISYSSYSNFIFLPNYNLSSVIRPNSTTVRVGVGGFGFSAATVIAASETPVSWVRLHFTHTNPTETTNLVFVSGTASITLFNPAGQYSVSGTPFTVNNGNLTLTGLNNQPLPVELSSFKANSVEGTKAQLNWETATEVNNYGFEIERSVVSENVTQIAGNLSNEVKETKWEKVAFVEGHGNSNSPKLYSFTDKNLVGGSKFMYRLKQIDIDGTFEYSEAVEIEVLPTKYELMQNYPNPFNPTTNIKFSLPEDAKVSINIYNILGEKVASILNEELKAGFHQVDFNALSSGYQLASGIYLYSIESSNFRQVKKMMLMK